MHALGVSEARTKLPQLVDEVDERLEQLFITKNGRTKAVLISADEFESWIETIASYKDKETRKRNKQVTFFLLFRRRDSTLPWGML